MKNIGLLLFVSFLTSTSYTQENEPSYSSEHTFQFAILPAFYINAATIAFGIKKENIEHVIEISSSYIPLGAERFAIGAYYNRNHYLKNDKTYIPFWLGVNRVNVDNNYEDGGPYYDKMNYSIGSGIGQNLLLKNSHKIKFEFGAGAALHMENRNSYDNESAFPFKMALNRFTISETYPVIPFFRFKIRYLLPLC
ncbi:MAG: hypothetical protein GQ574_17345 [Crocinitomix sp.]|nr:hypothetical protein [Crocinitomix sp.]